MGVRFCESVLGNYTTVELIWPALLSIALTHTGCWAQYPATLRRQFTDSDSENVIPGVSNSLLAMTCFTIGNLSTRISLEYPLPVISSSRKLLYYTLLFS